MIVQVNERTNDPFDTLSEVLGRPVPLHGGLPENDRGGLSENDVVAYWPALGSYTQDDEQETWTAAQWAQHLEDPLSDAPYATSPQGDRRAIFHLDVRLHPRDRDLAGAEWAEAAQRLARAAGIEIPGDSNYCHWVAVHAKPIRLDLIANLIRLDGAWQSQPADLLRRLSDEARLIEEDLRLTPAPTTSHQQTRAQAPPTAATQFATVLAQLADEQSGPLAAVRGLVEHTAHRIARQPDAAGPATAHRLEHIARRLYGIEQDLQTTATHLNTPPRPRTPVPPPPAARAIARQPR
ncbi:relaxase/mobilization nuclease [Streptomyces sp. NPDC091266]|uniref:relaxase/mobilization nuclease n=1 Tax=Streptomyces sp. NPDC091266 TaxID=3365978 RepID=UPI00380CD7B4